MGNRLKTFVHGLVDGECRTMQKLSNEKKKNKEKKRREKEREREREGKKEKKKYLLFIKCSDIFRIYLT